MVWLREIKDNRKTFGIIILVTTNTRTRKLPCLEFRITSMAILYTLRYMHKDLG